MKLTAAALAIMLSCVGGGLAAAQEIDSPRVQLRAADLLAGNAQQHLVPMQAYAPGPGAGPPLHVWAGVLSVPATRGHMNVLADTLSIAPVRALHVDTLPAFDIALIQDGDRLIPTQRGPIPGTHPNWEMSIEPGRVWSEFGDDGWSRAALPFALIEVNANCTHNGVLTFLYRDGEVSRLAWQIASETCAYFRFDFWGVAAARYRPAHGNDLTNAAEAFRREQAGRLPVAALSELADRGVDVSGFASAADISPTALSTYGVVYQGVHYRGGCDTRAGPYPFCESLLLPSYSLAKSLVGGFGLMRLELLLPGAMSETIADHVEPCRRWDAVTLGDALDMTTGRYRSAESEADESALTTGRFFLSTTLVEKLNIACSLYPRREPAGSRWVYHTPDTFVLGAAMADLWRGHAGGGADFFDDVLVDGVYGPLGLSPTIRATRRTHDTARQPLTGWGLTLLSDDIAKVGEYLQHPERQQSALLAPAQLAAAMQREPDDPGLNAGDSNMRYNNGFWAWNAQEMLRCAHPVWVPFMSGFGGIVVALMPNGVTYYYVSDGGEFRWANAVRAADQIAPLCEARQ